MPAPTLTSVTISDTLIGASEQPTVTFTFSEPVRNFDLADITAFSGFLDFLEPQGVNSPIWTARFNPFPNTDLSNQFIRVNLAGLQSAGDNTSGVGTFDSTQTYRVDTVRPTVTSFTISDPVLRVGETATVTIGFSEAVTLPIGSLFAQQAVYSNLATADGGLTYTATLTPNANAQSNSVIALQLNGATDAAGNTTGAAQPGPNLNLNTIRPTLTISIDDDTVKAGQTATVTFTFSESVNGFDFNDISSFGISGSLGSPLPSGLTTYTASFTPFTNVTDLTNVFSVDLTGVTSATSGNAGAGTVQSPNIAVDAERPTGSIVFADTNLGVGQTSLVTITFSEAVTGFTNADLTLENGTLSAVSSSDGGVTWTGTFTPTAGVNDDTNTLTLDLSGVADGFGNAGVGTATAGYAIDSTRPSLVSVDLPSAGLSAGTPMIVTFVFSEAVQDFTTADITFPNARMGAPVTADNVTWFAALLPPLTAVEDATNVLTINLAGVRDPAGNAGVGTVTSANYTVDTARPDLTVTFADPALAVGETSLVTFAFTEPVTGFDLADLAVDNGGLTAPVSLDGGRTWTSTYTPNAGLNDATNLLRVDRSGVVDLAGNAGTGFAFSPNFVIDSTAPTATISISDTEITGRERPTVTVTFSERMGAFSLVTPNGAVGGFTVSGDGLTYTATYTPNGGTDDATNVISFAPGARDVAGNLLSGSPVSQNFTINTPPDGPIPPPYVPPPLPTPGAGADTINGQVAPDSISGGDGADSISGGDGADTLSGDAGDDMLQGNTGSDTVMGGAGNDILHGGQDDDLVQGGQDNDVVFGDRGADTVLGGQGDDQVFGGEGDDFLSGDRGSDTLTGGPGADIFHSFGAAGLDRVTDFNVAEGDRVRLDAGTVYTVAQVGADTVVSMTGGAQLVLAGVQLSTLSDGWIGVG